MGGGGGGGGGISGVLANLTWVYMQVERPSPGQATDYIHSYVTTGSFGLKSHNLLLLVSESAV